MPEFPKWNNTTMSAAQKRIPVKAASVEGSFALMRSTTYTKAPLRVGGMRRVEGLIEVFNELCKSLGLLSLRRFIQYGANNISAR